MRRRIVGLPAARLGWLPLAALVWQLAATLVVAEPPTATARPAAVPGLSVTSQPFGKMPDGAPVELFTLANRHGMRVKVLPYGATIIAVEVPDRSGKTVNVTLGLPTFGDYLAKGGVLGTIVGRYANRIRDARFSIDGVEYRLAVNSGPNHIHGGRKGFNRVLWNAAPLRTDDAVGVSLGYVSADGEEGYPGRLTVRVRYLLNDANELTMAYEATTDRPTHANLTNHTYWNLSGGAAADVLSHVLTLDADRYLPIDATLTPVGQPQPVQDTPMDFRRPTALGARIAQVKGGYDHCYVLNKPAGKADEPVFAARLLEPVSGRVMELRTTQPGVQLYTDNGAKHRAVCLETQHYPNSPNEPSYPSTLLRPGEVYRQVTVHKFSVAAR